MTFVYSLFVLIGLAMPALAYASSVLTNSGPVVASKHGQVIENLRIHATGTAAIRIYGRRGVVIRNIEITHDRAHGIECKNSPDLIIERVAITNARLDPGGKNPYNIHCQYSDNLRIAYVRLRGGATGAWILESRNAYLTNIEGYDFVGRFPRGQLVQFVKSDSCTLTDFSVVNDPSRSWSEDNISVYKSNNCVIRRGLIDGNNSPSGVGVMFEYSSNGLVEDVDALRMGNGAFSAYPGWNITFRRTRARDNICADQGRGKPMSNALLWAGSPDSSGLRLEDAVYFNSCNGNILWHVPSYDYVWNSHAKGWIAVQDFTPRKAVVNVFAFE